MTEPTPQGRYRSAKRVGDLVFTSGMTPRRRGMLMLAGKVEQGQPLQSYQEAVQLAASNALTAARSRAGEGEEVCDIISMTVFIAAGPDFTEHTLLADFASDFLHLEMGEAGIGARAAIGVASLPSDAIVEIQLVAKIESKA